MLLAMDMTRVLREQRGYSGLVFLVKEPHSRHTARAVGVYGENRSPGGVQPARLPYHGSCLAVLILLNESLILNELILLNEWVL